MIVFSAAFFNSIKSVCLVALSLRLVQISGGLGIEFGGIVQTFLRGSRFSGRFALLRRLVT